MSPEEKNLQLKHIYGRRDYVTQIAVLNEKVENIESDVSDLKKALSDVHEDLKKITDFGSKWKGIFFVILSVGAIISGIIGFFEKMFNYLPNVLHH